MYYLNHRGAAGMKLRLATSSAGPEPKKLVAHAWNGDDQFRKFGILLQFLTKVADMNIYCPRECSAVVTPDCEQKFVTRERNSGSFKEMLKEFKF
jgi:hypothetical protein